MNDLTTCDQCVARQREIEKQLGATKDKDQRLLLKSEFDAVLDRMRELKAERKAKAEAEAAKLSRELPKTPDGKRRNLSESDVRTQKDTQLADIGISKPQPEVIVLRRSARPPSRPPISKEPLQPRAFADLRAGIAAETRRR